MLSYSIKQTFDECAGLGIRRRPISTDVRRDSLIEVPYRDSKPIPIEQRVYLVVRSWKIERLRECSPKLPVFNRESVPLKTTLQSRVSLAEMDKVEGFGITVC